MITTGKKWQKKTTDLTGSVAETFTHPKPIGKGLRNYIYHNFYKMSINSYIIII